MNTNILYMTIINIIHFIIEQVVLDPFYALCSILVVINQQTNRMVYKYDVTKTVAESIISCVH